MNSAELMQRTQSHVQSVMAGDSAHDWWHIDRVRRMALLLAREEGADPLVVELAALLHDIADWKFAGGDEGAGPRAAAAWLTSEGVDEATTSHVARIIAQLSFKGAGVPTPMETLEGCCVQDADRLDALGAIGIARTFAYGGAHHRPLHDPNVSPVLHGTFAAYKAGGGPTINHFHEKLLLLADRMNTAAARRLAAARHAYMEQFLAQFHAEWTGER